MAVTTSSIISSYIINLVTCFICFLIFSFLRLSNQAKRFFAPRRYAPDVRLKPRKLPTRGVFTWMWPIFSYSEGEIIDEVGLDAAMYLRIFTLGFQLFAGLSLWCLIAVLPVNLSGGAISHLEDNPTVSDDVSSSSFDRCSLSNVPEKSSLMWMHAVSVWVVTLFTLWMLWRFNKDSVKLRVLFLARSRPGGPTHTVLVTDIPGIAAMVPGTKQMAAVFSKFKKSKTEGPADAAQAGAAAGDTVPDAAGSSSSVSAASAAQGKLPEGTGKEVATAAASAPAVPSEVVVGEEVSAADAGGPGETPAQLQVALVDSAGVPVDNTAVRIDSTAVHIDNTAVQIDNTAMLIDTSSVPADNAGVPVAPTAVLIDTSSVRPDNTAMLIDNAEVRVENGAPNDKPEPVSDGVAMGHRGPGPVAEAAGDGLLQPLEVDSGAGPSSLPTHSTLTIPDPGMGAPMYLRRRRNYDVHDPWLDAQASATTMLSSGMSAKAMIEAEFRGVYSDSVVAVNTVNSQAALEPLVAEYDAIRQNLEDYLDECNFRIKKGKFVERKKILVLGSMGEWGKARGYKWWNKPDAIDHWTARLKELARLIKEKQDKCRERYTSAAFVTFSSRVAQCAAASSLHFHDETSWRTQNAPEPGELVWSNLAVALPVRTTREGLMWALFILMTLFYMIPVAALQSLINLDNLSKNETLADIVNAPVIKQLLQAILPGLILMIFLAMVPTVLKWFMYISGAISFSEIDFGVVTRFHIFQVVVVFLYNVIGSSIVTSFQGWIHDPSSAITMLGTAIPAVANFFITYIMIKGVGAASVGLLRVVPLILHWVFMKLAKSPKAQMRIWSEQYIDYGDQVAMHTIILMLGLVYCLINPIITPTVLLYFTVTLIVQRYQTIYVYRKRYESGGRMWRVVFHQNMFSLYLFQFCMLGLLSIKKFGYSPIIIVPSIIVTIFYHCGSVFMFSRPWTLAAQHDAAELDRREHSRQALLASPREDLLKSDEPLPVEDTADASDWARHYDVEDVTRNDPKGADGPEEVPEPVEVAYLSRVFKLRMPEDIEGLLREAEEMVGRIEAQPPKLTKKEMKERKKATKEEGKRGKKAGKDMEQAGSDVPASTPGAPTSLAGESNKNLLHSTTPPV